MDVIAYPGCDYNQAMSVKWVPLVQTHFLFSSMGDTG